MRAIERFGPRWRRYRVQEPIVALFAAIAALLLMAQLCIVISWLLLL